MFSSRTTYPHCQQREVKSKNLLRNHAYYFSYHQFHCLYYTVAVLRFCVMCNVTTVMYSSLMCINISNMDVGRKSRQELLANKVWDSINGVPTFYETAIGSSSGVTVLLYSFVLLVQLHAHNLNRCRGFMCKTCRNSSCRGYITQLLPSIINAYGCCDFVTFNVRGGRDPTKRARIRNFCKSHKTSLVCLITGNSL